MTGLFIIIIAVFLWAGFICAIKLYGVVAEISFNVLKTNNSIKIIRSFSDKNKILHHDTF